MTKRFAAERFSAPSGAVSPIIALLAVVAVTAVTGLLAPPADAETLRYTVKIPVDQSVRYELPLELRHPGTLEVHAEWTGPRVLALRLDAAGTKTAVARRSGSSPVTMKTELEPEQIGLGPWTLAIHSVAASGGGEGLITIELPRSPQEEAERAVPEPPPPPPPEPDPWMIARRPPTGSPTDWVRFFEDTERFRSLLDNRRDVPEADACRWQTDLMRYLADSRDRLVRHSALPSGPTRRMLQRIADDIRAVEELRTSTDPLIAGPPPQDRKKREVWLRLRQEPIQALEFELDELLLALQRGHAPEIAEEEWTVRLVSCVAACERHFEARIRVGEERATNRELAAAQWSRLLAAGNALRALAALRHSQPVAAWIEEPPR